MSRPSIHRLNLASARHASTLSRRPKEAPRPGGAEGRPLTSFTFHNGVFYLPVSHKWVINYPLRPGVPSAGGIDGRVLAKARTSRAAPPPPLPCRGQRDDLENFENFGHLPGRDAAHLLMRPLRGVARTQLIGQALLNNSRPMNSLCYSYGNAISSRNGGLSRRVFNISFLPP